MFKKAAVFTDIHFGLKGNSKVHNQDCEDFIDWYIQQAKDKLVKNNASEQVQAPVGKSPAPKRQL